jgi:hypothetical protein
VLIYYSSKCGDFSGQAIQFSLVRYEFSHAIYVFRTDVSERWFKYTEKKRNLLILKDLMQNIPSLKRCTVEKSTLKCHFSFMSTKHIKEDSPSSGGKKFTRKEYMIVKQSFEKCRWYDCITITSGVEEMSLPRTINLVKAVQPLHLT